MFRDSPPSRLVAASVCAALAALVVVVYWPVAGFDFVNFDDPKYVYANAQVRAGLSWGGVEWAFTALHASNWHPITWLSHMLDVSLFGVDAGRHHAVNVAFHLANTLLLFLLLHTATRSPWRSALVAALFAAHPLHVESVAWLSERKDVLSTFFWFAALLAYVRYARGPSLRRYVGVSALFVLGLLSKPMVVMLPLTLVVLDVWPLRRWVPGRDPARAAWPLLREKIPLAALSLAAALVTMVAQSTGGTVSSVRALPVGERVANAVTSYAVYLGQTLWPTGLAAFYPHPSWTPEGISAARVATAAALFAAITAVAIWQARRRPYLIAGWGWYVLTLLPVIGLVQVGAQAHADRYTYVPLVGVFWGVIWAVPSPGAKCLSRIAATVVAAAVLAASAVATRVQAGYWRDTPTLFNRALAVTEHNALAWANLGTHYQSSGDQERAIAALQQSLRIDPQSANNWLNLGAALHSTGRAAEAAHAFENGVKLAPEEAEGWLQLGLARLELRDPGRAVVAFERAVAMDANQPTAWAGLAVGRALTGDKAGALAARDRLLPLDPALAREVDARVAPMLAR